MQHKSIGLDNKIMMVPGVNNNHQFEKWRKYNHNNMPIRPFNNSSFHYQRQNLSLIIGEIGMSKICAQQVMMILFILFYKCTTKHCTLLSRLFFGFHYIPNISQMECCICWGQWGQVLVFLVERPPTFFILIFFPLLFLN